MRLSLILLLLACATGQPEPAPPSVEVDLSDLPGASLYQLTAPLNDQHGRQVSLSVFAGKPVLISMFYASCTSACPMLVNDVRKLEGQLSPQELAQVRVLLISLDPAADTPAVLAEAAARYGVDAERWLLTSPQPADVRTIAAALGIAYQAIEAGEFHHSSRVTLLDAQGVPRATAEGLGQPPDALIKALRSI